MSLPDQDSRQVSVELLQFSNIYWLFVFNLHESIQECCDLLHHLPLPKWLANWEAKWGCDCKPPAKDTQVYPDGWKDEGCDCWSKFSDYYGDSWGDIWHWLCDVPIMDYLWTHAIKAGRLRFFINVPITEWDSCPDDIDVNWIRDNIEQEKKYDKDEFGYSEAPYKDYPGETLLYKVMEWVTRRWRTPMCDGNGPQN
jgi:hypothetical protein